MPWKKGQSGNPGGRPKKSYEVQERFRELSPQAEKALLAALETPGERVAAARIILERAWGKPQSAPQDSHASVGVIPFRWMPVEERQRDFLRPLDGSSGPPTGDGNGRPGS